MARLTGQKRGIRAPAPWRFPARWIVAWLLPVLMVTVWVPEAGAVTDADVATLRASLESAPTDASNFDERASAAGRVRDALGAAGQDIAIYLTVFEARGRTEMQAGDLQAAYRTLHRYCWALVRHWETGRPDVGSADPLGATHPHLFFDGGQAAGLRTPKDAEHATMLEVNRLSTGQFGADQPLSYDALVAQDGLDPWRTYGTNLVELAFRAVITGEAADIANARRWLLAVCAYPHWGSGSDTDRDLPAAHLLLGTALAYDWLYGALSDGDRALVRRKLTNQAALMHAYAAGYASVWWRDTWTQNHTAINNAGLAMAGYALRGEVEEAAEWTADARANAERVLAALERIGDGSYHEGVPYWSYMMSFLLVQLQAIEREEGDDLIASNPWMRETLFFRLYAQQPDWRTVVSFADGPFVDYDGPQHILRGLDARFRTGYGEWLARQLTAGRGPMYFERRRWAPFEYLWYDPTVAPKAPTDLPPTRLFPDLDLLIMRSGWGADATVVTLKSGSPGGRTRFDDALAGRPGAGTLNAGHDHPNQNGLSMFAYGAPLLTGPGYPRPKRTFNHNTLLIDGAGQVGEGGTWFHTAGALAAGARGRIAGYLGLSRFDYAVADAADAYPATAGVTRCTRRVLFLKPAYVLVVDRVDLDAPRPVRAVWRRYGEPFTIRGGTVAAETGGGPTLWVSPVEPSSLQVRRGTDTASPGGEPFYYATMTAPRASRANRFVFLLAASPAASAGAPTGTLLYDGPDAVRVAVTDSGGTYAAVLGNGPAVTTAPAAGLTGDVGVVRTDSNGAVVEYFLGNGVLLRDVDAGRPLVEGPPGVPVTVQVELAGGTARVEAGSDAQVRLYAPGVTSVSLNGGSATYVRDGDFITIRLAPAP